MTACSIDHVSLLRFQHANGFVKLQSFYYVVYLGWEPAQEFFTIEEVSFATICGGFVVRLHRLCHCPGNGAAADRQGLGSKSTVSHALSALQTMEIESLTAQGDPLREQRAEIERVQTMLTRSLGPFRPHPRIDTFLAQFQARHLGVKYRFKSLGLFGGSQTGKTSKAMSLFGRHATLRVNCQGYGFGRIPDIQQFDRNVHKAIVWDDVRPDQVLCAKEVFTSVPWVLTMNESRCDRPCHNVWLYGIAHILCSNSFPMTDHEGQRPEDAYWLQSNIIDVTLAVGERWYGDQASA